MLTYAACFCSALDVQRCNYRRRMHNNLFVDEFVRRKAMSRYNLVAVELLALKASWVSEDGKALNLPPGQVLTYADVC
jgi:hypothetical protein